MCTVSFIPLREGVMITSNRDERHTRPVAIPPMIYHDHHTAMLYPKDTSAGGTWIGANENGACAVLLNGAFEKHISHPPYRQSRGLIIPSILQSTDPLYEMQCYNCHGIEPFTLVLYYQSQLFRFTWDEKQLHLQNLKASLSHIWSSSTLYPEDTRRQRELWFRDWQAEIPRPSIKDTWLFHTTAGKGDRHNGLLMNRNNTVFTVSITSVEINTGGMIMRYRDVQQNSDCEISMGLKANTE